MGKKKKTNNYSSSHRGTGFGILLLPVFFLLLGGLIWKIAGEFRSSKLGKFQRYNTVISSDSSNRVNLLSINIVEETAVLIIIPHNVYLDVPPNYGKYRLGSVWDLGELDKKGGRLLSETIQDFAAVPVDGFIRLSTPITNDYQDNILRGILNWKLLEDMAKGKIKTNLSVFDIGRLILKGVSLRFDKIKIYDLEKMGILDELILADGSKTEIIDDEKLDYYTKDEFRENDIVLENLKSEVLNASGQLGLGAKTARILTNLGIDVLTVGNFDGQPDSIDFSKREKCVIKTSRESIKKITTLRVKQAFGCNTQEGENERVDFSLIIQALHPGE